MARRAKKIWENWILETRELFRDFLDETDFPDLKRLGERGPTFEYPEWIFMFIAHMSVKLRLKTYVQIHKMAMQYWCIIAKDFGLPFGPVFGMLHVDEKQC
jgi:hypothetical protein